MKYLPFLGSEVKQSEFNNAFFHFIPVPLEKSVSYGKGTKLGPSAILKASWELETFDGISDPSKANFHTHKPVNCNKSIENISNQLNEKISSVLKINKLPVILGGEHTVTALAVKSVKESISDFGIIHFDAHADLKDTYQNNPYSHACTIKRVFDLGCPIVQFGIRSLTEKEDFFRQKNKITFYDAQLFFNNKSPQIMIPLDFPDKIYITIDVDVFDPSLMPATGTPEPGGLMWYQVIDILQNIIEKKKVIGFDVVELAPKKNDHSSDFICAKLIYSIIGMIDRKVL
ncbi:MAG: agmatinase [Spirochaetes bacterium]|nr:agmatinase [Spirochaetota bacterium]